MKNDDIEVSEEFVFLNRLRVSGQTNMWGADVFLFEAFNCSLPEAKKILLEWMAWVSEDPSRRDIGVEGSFEDTEEWRSVSY